MAEKLKPIGHYLGQLDSSDYNGRGDMMKAARSLRAEHRARINVDKRNERAFKNRQLTMAEKRAMVRAGTHRWCHKCHGRGLLKGKDGALLPHGPCKSDGLIRVRSGGPKGGRSASSRSALRPTGRRRHRGKKAAVGLAGLGTVWTVLGETLGTVGQVVALVVIVVVVVLKVAAFVLRGVAAVTR